jgi:hypothetical protein
VAAVHRTGTAVIINAGTSCVAAEDANLTDGAEAVKYAEKVKEIGNEYFKKGDIKNAAAKYEKVRMKT